MSNSTEDCCPVCLTRMSVFAVGQCDHPVCGECSVRVRVLCSQKECPICRQNLNKVVLMPSFRPFSEVSNQPFPMLPPKFGVCFSTAELEAHFTQMLAQKCPKCKKSYHQFADLERHVRREHQLFYCTICAFHLKLFTHERRLFTRSELATHNLRGDGGSGSQGHPKCPFCSPNRRFPDEDELYRHLKRDHFSCHLCQDDRNVFFGTYKLLNDHFRAAHYLCQEGDCRRQRFTSAFGSEIDFKAHVLAQHGHALSKAEAHQTRLVLCSSASSNATISVITPEEHESCQNSPPSSSQSPLPLQPPQLNYDSFPTLDGTKLSAVEPVSRPVQPTEHFPALGSSRRPLSTYSARQWEQMRRRRPLEDYPSLQETAARPAEEAAQTTTTTPATSLAAWSQVLERKRTPCTIEEEKKKKDNSMTVLVKATKRSPRAYKEQK